MILLGCETHQIKSKYKVLEEQSTFVINQNED